MNNPYELTNKVALITGGAQGIGYGIASEFIKLGAKVVITGRTLTSLENAQKTLGDNCKIYQNDVREKASLQALVDSVEKEVGYIDILVNNAGKHSKKPTLEVTDEEFQSVMDINVNSAFALTRTVLNKMIKRGHGSVIFISSMAAIYGLQKVIAYSSSKTALLGMVRSLASDYSHTGIRFNAIAPGYIESKMLDEAMKNDTERKARVLSRTPMGRLGKPKEIGMAAAFLASDASEYITGVCLPVDGGNSIGF